MGTIFAPTYATLVMGYLEIKLYSIIETKFDTNTKEYFVENWDRFLDDCFVIVPKDKIDPHDLLNILNSINPFIKFTMEVSENTIPFLDISVNKDQDNIWMDIYSKPTDSKRYVPFDSCHPKHCLKNIPYCLARRICMIVECNKIKLERLSELKLILETQNYPKTLISNGIERALKSPQQELRTEKTVTDKKVLAFITTHNPNNPDLFGVIKTSVDHLKNSTTLKEELKKYELINAKKTTTEFRKAIMQKRIY